LKRVKKNKFNNYNNCYLAINESAGVVENLKTVVVVARKL